MTREERLQHAVTDATMKGREFVASLRFLTPEQRLERLAWVARAYCLKCGGEQPESGRCNCGRDE